MFAMPGQESELEAAWDDLSALDPRHPPLDAGEARAMVPVLRPDQVVGAVFEPDAMDIDVHELHQGYLRRLRQRGGRVVTGAEVLGLSHGGKAWTASTTAGDFTAPVVVNAAGAWADALATLAGLPPIGLVPKPRTALTIATPAGLDTSLWPMTLDVGERASISPDAGRLGWCRPPTRRRCRPATCSPTSSTSPSRSTG